MINIPRALFQSRTGRQPIYHIGIDEAQDWAYGGERLVPLKGYPGVVWTRPSKKGREFVPSLKGVGRRDSRVSLSRPASLGMSAP